MLIYSLKRHAGIRGCTINTSITNSSEHVTLLVRDRMREKRIQPKRKLRCQTKKIINYLAIKTNIRSRYSLAPLLTLNKRFASENRFISVLYVQYLVLTFRCFSNNPFSFSDFFQQQSKSTKTQVTGNSPKVNIV